MSSDRAFVVAEPAEVLEADSPAVMLMIIEPIHCARLAFCVRDKRNRRENSHKRIFYVNKQILY